MKRLHRAIGLFMILTLIGLFAAGCTPPEQESAYFSAVQSYYSAIEKQDFAEMKQALPPQALDALGMNAADLLGTHTRYANQYGKSFTVSVKEKGSRALDEKQCKDLSAYLRGDYSISTPVSSAYLAEFTVRFSGELDEQSLSKGYVVYQLGEQWYMDLWADANVSSIRSLYDESN